MHYESPLVTFLNLTFDLSIILTSTNASLIVFLFALLHLEKLPPPHQNIAKELYSTERNE